MLESVPDGSLYINIILFCGSLIFCAFFSFLETSITAIRLYKLQELAQTSTGQYTELFRTLEQNQSRVLTTILVANNLANVIAAMTGDKVAEALFSHFPPIMSGVLRVIFITAMILIVGEVVPKNLARTVGERFFKYTLWITNVACIILYPVVTIFLKISNYTIQKIRGPGETEEEVLTSEKEIRFLIDYINKKGLLEEEKTNMLKSIFELGTTSVRDILIPATSVVSISSDTTVAEALRTFKKYQFSRFPVYEHKQDNIIGMLHLKDLFAIKDQEQASIKSVLRPILFVPDSLKVNQLLKEFKEQHMHIAMVLNEHGIIIGLVTLEDVLEEIVGEIKDEYEESTDKIIKLKDGAWLVDAGLNLKELEEHLQITFETDGALTLGGFLTEKLQHLPRKGNRIAYKGYQFQVQQASQRRALQVLIFSEKLQTPVETL
jgi:putative hemolysin